MTGAVSVADVAGRATYRTLRSAKSARSRAKSDWHAVGHDFAVAMEKVEAERLTSER